MTTTVIPGRCEASSYDVQLHIRESIEPHALAEKWIPGSRCARPGMTAFT
ncbi:MULTISPECIES: hypothetical protein [Bradyrhizobium]|nr:hypothetical protein [Bradyrhizobium elkanii]